MQHTCYHVISDHNNVYLGTIEDVKSTVVSWKNNGESHINIYRIVTEELDSDEIILNEELIPPDNFN